VIGGRDEGERVFSGQGRIALRRLYEFLCRAEFSGMEANGAWGRAKSTERIALRRRCSMTLGEERTLERLVPLTSYIQDLFERWLAP